LNRSILALYTSGRFVVRAAIRQLNNKDVRQRRRAVRKLFELDDPVAIDAFIPLLNDSDEWFRGKALIAIQKWASMKDLELAEKLANSIKPEERILACRIAPKIGKSCELILKKLSDDEEQLVKQNAWKVRLEQDEHLIREAITVDESGIRILAMEKIEKMENIEDEVIKIILTDKSSRVRKKAVSLLRIHPELNHSGKYDEIIIDIAENDKNAQIDAIIMLIESGRESKVIREKIPAWLDQKNPQMVKSIIESLKNKNWSDKSDLIAAIINSSNDKLISGILRRNNSVEANKIRKDILLDENNSDILRARIIEDLFGKNQNDEKLMEIIKELQNSNNESISNSAKMFIKSIE
jgi:HEAT repeat protein|tara:strand:- start:589 stop:1647 length:1059 start_codon:yes stop_codon:yes gene_type:complete